MADKNCNTCKHADAPAWDPDCMHPDVTKTHRIGLPVERAIARYCTPELKLYEPKEKP